MDRLGQAHSRNRSRPDSDRAALCTISDALRRIRDSFVVTTDSQGQLHGAQLQTREAVPGPPMGGFLPACRIEDLGDPAFCTDHGIRYPYIAGAMANGIGSVELVEAMGRAGLLGFFGAAGLPLERVEAAIARLSGSGNPYGFNLIHSPNEPGLEQAMVDLYHRRGVRLVSASAYLGLTPAVVHYRVHGTHTLPNGDVVSPNRIIAKVSRVEVASQFMSPPPTRMLADLVAAGRITDEEARLAAHIPVAQDLTVEADSGGHTDNRPALTLLPTMIALRDEIQQQHNFSRPLRVGMAGGIATPLSATAAFSMGAAFVLTGSINQSCIEAGTSGAVRRMLADARQADVMMAPAADMFEMGVKVQVLKRGTLFPVRATKLLELYRQVPSLEAIPQDVRTKLERDLFRDNLETVWQNVQAYFRQRDPRQIERAQTDDKHRMALVFRSYLGQASHWANQGEPGREVDYQIWCGPSMGAFNAWVKDSFLEPVENRTVVSVAMNILYGAAFHTRANSLSAQGVRPPSEHLRCQPRQALEGYPL